MKRYLLAIISLGLLASCSVKTNEEKARELIEPEVKAGLVKPESYEFAKLQLDSCFSDSQNKPDIVVFALQVTKLWNEYKEYSSGAERAESSMTIYMPSYGYQSAHSKLEQKKYKAEMEKAQRKAADTKEKIVQLYKGKKKIFEAFKSGEHEFIGWMAVFSYRGETAGGIKSMGESLFYLNKDLTEITYRFEPEELSDIQAEDLDDIRYEFEDELKEIFGEE